MPKYMKDPRLKPPRENRVELDIFIKYKKKAKSTNTQKSNHKHQYEKVLLSVIDKKRQFSYECLGKRCTICGKISGGELLFLKSKEEIEELTNGLLRVKVDNNFSIIDEEIQNDDRT